jgi:tetratricopeptide (TPR) repeat protein
MKPFQSLGLVAAICAWLGLASPLAAHEGPEHEIEELTELLNRGETADLFLQRAIEYRVLGKLGEAARDLEHAIRLGPEKLLVHRELGRVYFSLGKTNEALDTISHALKLKTDEPNELAALHASRAEILKARADYKKSLEDCNQAIQLHKQNVDWYILRSDLHERLKQPKERLDGIRQGIDETGSGVLELEWIEALLDDKQFAEALKKIEPELQSSRIRSSWLVRRARAQLGLGKTEAAKTDLEEAIQEMSTRINPSSPDVTLLTERAQAHEMLKDRDSAKHWYELARDAGAEDWVKEKIKAIKAEEDAEKEPKEKSKEKSKDKDKDKDKPSP